MDPNGHDGSSHLLGEVVNLRVFCHLAIASLAVVPIGRARAWSWILIVFLVGLWCECYHIPDLLKWEIFMFFGSQVYQLLRNFISVAVFLIAFMISVAIGAFIL